MEYRTLNVGAMQIVRKSPRVRSALATMVCVATLGVAGSAAAQWNDSTMQGRLARLESDVANLNRLLSAGDTVGAPTGAAGVEVRLARLERQIQELTGRTEQATYQLSQITERLNRMAKDYEFRLDQLEGSSGAGAIGPGGPAVAQPRQRAPELPRMSDPGSDPFEVAGTPPAAPATGPAAPRVTTTPARPPQAAAGAAGAAAGAGLPGSGAQQDYDYAFGFLRNADYEGAERSLTAFIAKYRDNPLAGNAQYWLGETYYVRGQYQQATVAFAEGIQKYPKSTKAPDNLLKLGMSLAQMNQVKDACVAFGQLGNQYPDASASLKRRAEQERQRLGCP